MDRALVVIDDTETHRELMAEAVDLAGDDGELVMFSWLTQEELDEDLDAIEAVERAEHANYGDLGPDDIVRNIVEAVARDALDDPNVEYEIASAVTDEDGLADEILAAAGRHDCDHVFLVGRKRSPTGKVLFGDVAQKVILNFDGLVTVTMD
jgi:nucleotide-binding universal stress UspA family protein